MNVAHKASPKGHDLSGAAFDTRRFSVSAPHPHKITLSQLCNGNSYECLHDASRGHLPGSKATSANPLELSDDSSGPHMTMSPSFMQKFHTRGQ